MFSMNFPRPFIFAAYTHQGSHTCNTSTTLLCPQIQEKPRKPLTTVLTVATEADYADHPDKPVQQPLCPQWCWCTVCV